jgi:hypothetical protein
MDKKAVQNNMAITEAGMYTQLTNLYCGYSSQHTQCSQVYANIKNNLSIFSNYNTLLTSFINSLNKGYYGSCVSAISCYELFTTLLDLSDIESLDNNTFKNMSLNTKFADYLITFISKMKKISPDLITKIIYSQNKAMIQKILLDSKLELNFIPEHIEFICSNYTYLIANTNHNAYYGTNYKISQNIPDKDANEFTNKLISELINRKIKVSKSAILLAILHNLNLSTIKTLLTLGPAVCEDYLIAACFSLNKDMIDFLLDNKIEPTSKCMQAIFKMYATDNLGFSVNGIKLGEIRKDKAHSLKDTTIIKKYTQIIETLLNYNYKLEYQDVLEATRNFVQVNNIEKYNIKLDSKFLEVCSEVGFYPNYKHDIKADIKCLQKECNKYGNLTAIKELVNKQHLKPDAICMENACKFKSNLQTIKFLYEKGAPIDHNAVKNIVHSNGNSAMIFIVDEYVRSLESKINKQNTNTKTNQLVDNNKNSENDNFEYSDLSDLEENVLVKDVEILIPTKKAEVVEDDEEPKVVKKIVEHVSESESESEEEIVKPKKSKKILIKKTKKTEEKEVAKEEIKVEDKKKKTKEKKTEEIKTTNNQTVTTGIKLDDYKLSKTKIISKEEVSLPAKFSKFFNLDKDVKLSVLSFKKILFNYFNNNKLIKKDSFEIELSAELCEAINFNKTKYGNKMDLKDIDAFCLFVLDKNYESNNSPVKQ